MNLVDAAAWVLAVSGCAFVLIGAIGMLRMPDFTTRAHAAGLIDVFGTLQILIALALQSGWGMVALKITLIIVFLLITAPAAIHAIFKTYLQSYPEP